MKLPSLKLFYSGGKFVKNKRESKKQDEFDKKIIGLYNSEKLLNKKNLKNLVYDMTIKFNTDVFYELKYEQYMNIFKGIHHEVEEFDILANSLKILFELDSREIQILNNMSNNKINHEERLSEIYKIDCDNKTEIFKNNYVNYLKCISYNSEKFVLEEIEGIIYTLEKKGYLVYYAYPSAGALGETVNSYRNKLPELNNRYRREFHLLFNSSN